MSLVGLVEVNGAVGEFADDATDAGSDAGFVHAVLVVGVAAVEGGVEGDVLPSDGGTGLAEDGGTGEVDIMTGFEGDAPSGAADEAGVRHRRWHK